MKPSVGLLGCAHSNQAAAAIAKMLDLYFLAQSAKHCLRNNHGRMKPQQRIIRHGGRVLASFRIQNGHDLGVWRIHEPFLEEGCVPDDLLRVLMGGMMFMMNGHLVERKDLINVIFQQLRVSYDAFNESMRWRRHEGLHEK